MPAAAGSVNAIIRSHRLKQYGVVLIVIETTTPSIYIWFSFRAPFECMMKLSNRNSFPVAHALIRRAS